MDFYRDDEPGGFPWFQAIVLVVAASVSVMGAGYIGALIAERMHDEEVGQAPYTAEQLRDLETVSAEAAGVAAMELAAWNESLEVSRSVARVQGEIVATLILMISWAGIIAIWLWRRARARHTARLIEENYAR